MQARTVAERDAEIERLRDELAAAAVHAEAAGDDANTDGQDHPPPTGKKR